MSGDCAGPSQPQRCVLAMKFVDLENITLSELKKCCSIARIKWTMKN